MPPKKSNQKADQKAERKGTKTAKKVEKQAIDYEEETELNDSLNVADQEENEEVELIGMYGGSRKTRSPCREFRNTSKKSAFLIWAPSNF